MGKTTDQWVSEDPTCVDCPQCGYGGPHRLIDEDDTSAEVLCGACPISFVVERTQRRVR